MPSRESARRARANVVLPDPVPGAKWIVLTQGRFALVDEADYELVQERNWSLSTCKRRRMVYASSRIPGTPRDEHGSDYLHRFLWAHWGLPPAEFIDHRNNDGLDCRRENLRETTSSQNHGNLKLTASNTSGYKGVYWSKQNEKWMARATKDRKMVYLGQFEDIQEAARTYDRYVIQDHIFGSHALTNFPRSDYED